MAKKLKTIKDNMRQIDSLKLLIIFIILFLSIKHSFGQRNLARDLKKSFKANDRERIQLIFQECSHLLNTNYNEIIGNDTIKSVYEIYDAFYTPDSLNRIGIGQWGDSLYVEADFYIVHNEIKYRFTDFNLTIDQLFPTSNQIYYADIESTNPMMAMAYFSEKFSTIDNIASNTSVTTLIDFRPKTRYNHGIIIYASPKLKTKLNRYLGRTYLKIGKKVIRKPVSFQRREFITPQVNVIRQHWNPHWYIETHPYIYNIIFDKKMENAIVDFRLGFQGGYAYVPQINTEWTIISSDLVWIV